MKRFAVFDIDGTLFRWQLYSEIVFELIEAGHIPKSAREKIEAKLSDWRSRTHARSFHDFELEVVNAFFASLAQLKSADIDAAADAVLSKSGQHVYAYTRSLIEELKEKDYVLIALSGSHDEIVRRFAGLWQFDIATGQAHAQKDGRYTGAIDGDTLLVLQKGDRLKKIVETHNLSWKDSIAIGDSLSDAAMLKLVDHPIAFNPNEELFEIAKKHGWKVVLERKNMIYELEEHHGTYVLAQANSR